jgi:hypothetical protein
MASNRCEIAIAAIEVPACLALPVQDYSCARDTVGKFGDGAGAGASKGYLSWLLDHDRSMRPGRSGDPDRRNG